MENKKQAGVALLLLSFWAICLVGCSDSEPNKDAIIPSVEKISLSGEGEETVISFTNPHWTIESITSIDKTAQLWGDIYTPDGELVRDNTKLALEGLGRLESRWIDHGFVISRDTPNQLKVEALENSSEDVFGFTILLASETETKEITIEQGLSAGYSFERIEYTLIPGSQRTVYEESTHFTFSNETGKEYEMAKYAPFLNQYNNFSFASDERLAFSWMADEAVEVEIPGGIWNGELFYNHESIPYQSVTSKLPLKFSIEQVGIQVPVGDSKCHFKIEYEEYQATYRIFLKNKATQAEKVFEGTFLSCCPNGEYELVWDTDNRPDNQMQ